MKQKMLKFGGITMVIGLLGISIISGVVANQETDVVSASSNENTVQQVEQNRAEPLTATETETEPVQNQAGNPVNNRGNESEDVVQADDNAKIDGMAEQMEEAMAEALGLSVAELEEAIDEGQSLPEIAEAQDVDLADVRVAVETAREEAIEQAVAEGEITEEEAAAMNERPSGPRPRNGGPNINNDGPPPRNDGNRDNNNNPRPRNGNGDPRRNAP